MTTNTQSKHVLRTWRPWLFPALALIIIAILASILHSLGRLDTSLTDIAYKLPKSWNNFFIDVSLLGTIGVTCVVAVLAAVYEWLHNRRGRARIMLASLLNVPLFYAVKEIVHRARPVTEFVIRTGLHDYSFPSGHTTASTAVYGCLALLIGSRLRTQLRWLVIIVVTIFIMLVGISRVYLGAHFPTDVIGGWLLGLGLISLLRTASIADALNMANSHIETDTLEAKS